MFARNPDSGEDVLYCYGNAGDQGGWITSGVSANAKKINISALVSGAAHVTVARDDRAVYADTGLTNVTDADFKLKAEQARVAAELPEDVLRQSSIGVPDGEGHILAEQLGDLAGTQTDLQAHKADAAAHVTAAERSAWNAKAAPYRFTATIPVTGWSASKPYTLTMNVPGITASMTPMVDVVQNANVTTAAAQLEAWSRISRMVIGEGAVTIYAYEDKPATAIPVQLTGVV